MRRFWLFRSNIKHLEYYHEYKDLESFEKNCHDYYLLLPLWLLQNDYFDEVIIWRLSDRVIPDTVFNINGKKYIQRWVSNFAQTFSQPGPDISFWRGGFQEYDAVTKRKPSFFGLKLYLGAGHRILPRWGGIYDAFLMEDERDFKKGKKCIPFYKTASPQIFKPVKSKIKWDLCWPCNFGNIRQKGQKFFIRKISESNPLKHLKIVHCGNKPKVGRQMCQQFGVNNIEFLGHIERPKLNEVLNQSRFGVNVSNIIDGCPRVSTEILMSGTPLILREETRLLKYYRKYALLINNVVFSEKIFWGLYDYDNIKHDTQKAINGELSFDAVNKKNIELWKKI